MAAYAGVQLHRRQLRTDNLLPNPRPQEIALTGQSGLDYASSEQKYRLTSLPGESFSGLQLMCLMYVGFKDIQPTLDVGMDLSEPYRMALRLYREEDQV